MRVNKKIIANILLSIFLLNSGFVFADTLHGHAEKVDVNQKEQSELFTGQVDVLDEKML